MSRLAQPPSPELRIACLDEPDAVALLVPEWTALWRWLPKAGPFQSPAWLMAWWRHFATGPARIVTAREEGRLVGVLPLYLREEATSRKLLPIGIGLSDYIDALCDPACAGAANALLDAVAQLPGWDECYLPDLAPGAALVLAACPPGLAETRQAAVTACPVLALPDSPAALAQIVPRKTLRDVRQARARADAAGPVGIAAADAADIDAAMQDLFRLHQKRWEARGEGGVCDTPEVRDFHRDAARALAQTGTLRLYSLSLAGAVAAVYYGFTCNRRAYAYLGGFDPDLLRLSPGALILHHAICAAIGEGVREFHFLRGGEAYKYAWGAVDRWNAARTFTRR